MTVPLPVPKPVDWAVVVPLPVAPLLSKDALEVRVVEGEPDWVGRVEGVLAKPSPPPPPLLAVG